MTTYWKLCLVVLIFSAGGSNALRTYTQGFIRSTEFTSVAGWEDFVTQPRMFCDINGDGNQDILGFKEDGAFLAYGDGTGSFSTVTKIPNVDLIGDNGWTDQTRMCVDLNADDFADIVGFNGTTIVTYTNQKDGTFSKKLLENFFTTQGVEDWEDYESFPRFAVDLDGNKMADLIAFGDGRVFVRMNLSDNQWQAENQVSDKLAKNSAFFDYSGQNKFARKFGDFNGDGNIDIIAFGNPDVVVAFGNGDGTFQEPTESWDSVYFGSGGFNERYYSRLIGDLDNDGKDDIIGFAVATFIGINQHPDSNTLDMSKTTGFSTSGCIEDPWGYQYTEPRLLVDLDNDKIPDIVGFGKYGMEISLSSLPDWTDFDGECVCRFSHPFAYEKKGDSDSTDTVTTICKEADSETGNCNPGFYSHYSRCLACETQSHCEPDSSTYCCNATEGTCSSMPSEEFCASVNPPSVESVKLMDVTPGLRVTFSVEATWEGKPSEEVTEREVQCADFLDDLQGLGNDPKCLFIEKDKIFEVRFGENATKTMNDSISLKSGVLRSTHEKALYTSTFASSTTIQIMDNPPEFTYELQAAKTPIGRCDDYQILITNIQGSYKQEFIFQVGFYYGENSIPTVDIGEDATGSGDQHTIVLKNDIIAANNTKGLVIRGANQFGKFLTLTLIIEIDTDPIISGLSSEDTILDTNQQLVLLVSQPYYPDPFCSLPSVYDAGSFTLEWRVEDVAITDSSSLYEAQTSDSVDSNYNENTDDGRIQTLKIPGGKFAEGDYSVKCRMISQSSSQPGSQPPIVYNITVVSMFSMDSVNGWTRSTRPREGATLEVEFTYSPENDPTTKGVDPPALQWECIDSKPENSCNVPLSKANQSGNSLTFNSEVLIPESQISIKVTAIYGGHERTGTFSVQVDKDLAEYEIHVRDLKLGDNPTKFLANTSTSVFVKRVDKDLPIIVQKYDILKETAGDNDDSQETVVTTVEVGEKQSNSFSLDSEALSLVRGQTYTLKVFMEDDLEHPKSGKFVVNHPPTKGTMTLSTEEPQELQEVSVTWSGWSDDDDDDQLTYTLLVKKESGIDEYTAVTKTSISVVFPKGTVQLTFSASDGLESVSLAPRTVDVVAIQEDKVVDAAKEALGSISEDANVDEVSNKVQLIFETVDSSSDKDQDEDKDDGISKEKLEEKQDLVKNMANVVKDSTENVQSTEEVAQVAETVEVLTTNTDFVTEESRTAIFDTMDTLLDKDITINDETSTSMAKGMSNLVDTVLPSEPKKDDEPPDDKDDTGGDEDKKAEEKERALDNVDKVVDKLFEKSLEGAVGDGKKVEITTENLSIAFERGRAAKLQEACIPAGKAQGGDKTEKQECMKLPDYKKYFPSSQLDGCPDWSIDVKSFKKSYNKYENKPNAQSQNVTSPVIEYSLASVCQTLREPLEVTDTQERLNITFPYDARTIEECRFWDKHEEMWSTNGCETLIDESLGVLTCSCNHLTEFAKLAKNFGQVELTLEKVIYGFAVTGFVLLAWIPLVYFAYKKDKKDEEAAILRAFQNNRLNQLKEANLLKLNQASNSYVSNNDSLEKDEEKGTPEESQSLQTSFFDLSDNDIREGRAQEEANISNLIKTSNSPRVGTHIDREDSRNENLSETKRSFIDKKNTPEQMYLPQLDPNESEIYMGTFLEEDSFAAGDPDLENQESNKEDESEIEPTGNVKKIQSSDSEEMPGKKTPEKTTSKAPLELSQISTQFTRQATSHEKLESLATTITEKRKLNRAQTLERASIARAWLTTNLHRTKTLQDKEMLENRHTTFCSFIFEEHVLASPAYKVSVRMLRYMRLTMAFSQILVQLTVTGWLWEQSDYPETDFHKESWGVWNVTKENKVEIGWNALLATLVPIPLLWALSRVFLQKPMTPNQTDAERHQIHRKNRRWVCFGTLITVLLWGGCCYLCVNLADKFGTYQTYQWLVTFGVSFIGSVLFIEPIKAMWLGIFFAFLYKCNGGCSRLILRTFPDIAIPLSAKR